MPDEVRVFSCGVSHCLQSGGQPYFSCAYFDAISYADGIHHFLQMRTLMQFRDAEDSVTWGVAHRVAEDKVDEVIAHLNHREKVRL